MAALFDDRNGEVHHAPNALVIELQRFASRMGCCAVMVMLRTCFATGMVDGCSPCDRNGEVHHATNALVIELQRFASRMGCCAVMVMLRTCFATRMVDGCSPCDRNGEVHHATNALVIELQRLASSMLRFLENLEAVVVAGPTRPTIT